MKVKIEFSIDNACFLFQDCGGEVAWNAVANTVADVADLLAREKLSGVIKDINGNTIGSYEVEGA